MKVSIATSTKMGRTYILDVEPSTTVAQLKTKFLQEVNDLLDTQQTYFVFDGEILQDENDTLESYGIEDDALLHAFSGNGVKKRAMASLGIKFLDVSDDKSIKIVQWSRTGPQWQRTRHGLCLQGICTNVNCQAAQQHVIMPIGYKKFDMVTDPDETTTKCPMCGRFVAPKSCGFNNCWWRFQGKKQIDDNKAPVSCESEWQQAGDAYHYFDDKTTGTVTWRKLTIEATKKKTL
ncbi:unnamed protein product [Adineta ricciae]|uniref:Ubiquitin-like domain-containing protein n=1 Tax=Adineta ricciae TaxID=249248 RepID=A0A814ZIV0_ADIRI|nr:unnamed protein product [Adineta ricciae]